MEEKKRMAGEYEIVNSLKIGGKEIVYGINEKSRERPYMCAYYTSNALWADYSECVMSHDYIKIIDLFAQRIKDQCVKVQEQRNKITVPKEVISADMCYPNNTEKSIKNKVVAVKASVFCPEYQRADCQLIYVNGGFGADANSRGSACFATNLYSGENERFERYDIQGEVKPECLPDWAKAKVAEIQAQKVIEQSKKRREER